MQVTKNEKFLLTVLAAVVFLIANWFGYRFLVQKQTAMSLSVREMRADEAEAKVELLESDRWAQRMAWIQSKQPAMTDEDDAKAQVLEYVLKGARDNQLEIEEQNLNDVEHGAGGARVNVSVKVKGAMESLVKWLTAIEKPEQFYAVSSFSLKADPDQKSFICTVQFARFFKDKEGS